MQKKTKIHSLRAVRTDSRDTHINIRTTVLAHNLIHFKKALLKTDLSYAILGKS